ncbi:mucin-19 [Anopheles cruzii]|uniref:mucin-19 n=1 Tax=Anopheles cruzii TaxID=68878 RepID=UPI0022EC8BAF|nr:mucin-19 [Anopheles cruzii]
MSTSSVLIDGTGTLPFSVTLYEIGSISVSAGPSTSDRSSSSSSSSSSGATKRNALSVSRCELMRKRKCPANERVFLYTKPSRQRVKNQQRDEQRHYKGCVMSAPEGTGGGGIGDKSSSASSSVGGGGGKPVSSGGGGGAAAATTTIPIDLASASKVLVRTDKTTMPTTTYRIGSAPGNQMRVVIPSSAAQQTYYRQPANIKQDTTTNRTQISALSAARTVVTQTASLTVSRAQTTTPTTVSYHVSNRCVPATPIVTANLPPGAVRATTINGPIRISTPPIQVATNNSASGANSGTSAGVVSTGGSTTYVRMPPNVLPARSSAQAAAAATTATIISQSNHNNSTTTTLVPNFQMSAQLIRATGAGTVAVTGGGAAGVGGGVPRARVVTQTTIPTNHHPVVVASGGTATPLAVVNSSTPTVGGSQGVGGGGGQQTGVAVSNTSPQAFVATLSTVLQAPRQVSTLVYTNNSATQQYTIGPNQQQQHRLALATTTLSPQRPTTLGGVGLSTPGTGGIRPTIQRLPTAGIRVSNFRPPGLASTTVLTTIASGVPGVSGTVTNSSQSAGQQQLQQQRTVATGTVVAPNISNAIPARIIQVQNPASGTAGTAQIVNGRIQTNLLNIQPLIVSSQNRLAGAGPAGTGGGLQPAAGLTIAQVGKLTQVATGAGNDPITTSAATATLQTASGQQIVVSTTGPGGGASPAATLIAGNLIGSGGTTHHGGQITHQIVGMNAPTVVSVATGAGAAGAVGAGGAGTATTVIPIPLALTGARQATVGATSGHSPLSIVTGPTGGASLGGIVRTGGTSGVVGTGTATSIASVLPIAKVTPQQQQQPLVTSLVETNVPNTAAAALHYSVASGVVGAGPSLYIQTRPGVASGGTMTVATSGSVGVPKGPAGATLSVVSSTGTGGGTGGGTSGAGASATTFLPTSTFYYERLTSSPAAGPVSIAAATSGVGGTSGSAVTLSSSTAITTTSTISGPVFSISSSSSVISSSASNSNSSVSSAIQSQSGGPHHSVVSSLTSYGASGSFAIVQAAPGGGQGGRATLTSGPIHGLVPASLASAGGAGGNVVSTTVGGSIVSVSRDPSAAIVPIRFHPQLLVDASGHHQAQQIIVSSSAGPGGGSTATNIVPLIPVNATSINVTSTSTTGAGSKQHQVESPQSSILRKRALEGTLKTLATPAAGRDLTQALIAVEKQQQQQELTLQLLQQHSALQHQPMELRGELIGSPMSPSRPPSSDGSTTVSATSTPGLDDQEDGEMRPIPFRNSHGGTSTALVLDGGHFKPVQEELPHFQQQQQHHLPRELAYPHHHHHGEGFITTQSAASSSAQTVTQIVNHMAAVGSSSAAGNGSSYEQSSARKKARKQLLQPMGDSGTVGAAGGSLMKSSSSSSSSSSSAATTGMATGQTSSQQQQQVFMAQDHVDGVTIGADGSSYAMSTAGPGIVILTTGGAQHHLATGSHKHNSVSGAVPKPIGGAGSSNSSSSLHNNVKLEPPTAASGQQQQQQQDAGAAPAPQPGGGSVPSTKPIVSSSRKTNNVSLLQSYKQTWKAANNHFQRYTDVKQREERRPTVMDIANQSHILQKVNGWKIYHLSAQIEELCDLESQAYGKLAQMLRSMEASGSGSSSSSSSASGSVSSIKSSSTDIERINDLLKGNMQRSKIVMDGINEARTQIMKIFDHKPRVSDIILRCASKRNFKKREKT